MARRHRRTGGRRGAPDGNQNALKHGVHSQIERAAKMEAHSAFRAARALEKAIAMDKQRTADAEDDMSIADDEQCEDFLKIMTPFRNAPNLKGILADIVRQRIAYAWMGAFNERAPDWVYAWADAWPNIYKSPVFNDGDPFAPGVGVAFETKAPGEGGEKILKTNTPPIRPNSLWRQLFIPVDYAQVEGMDPEVVAAVQQRGQFPSLVHARGYIDWKIRQYAEHKVDRWGTQLSRYAATGEGDASPS